MPTAPYAIPPQFALDAPPAAPQPSAPAGPPPPVAPLPASAAPRSAPMAFPPPASPARPPGLRFRPRSPHPISTGPPPPLEDSSIDISIHWSRSRSWPRPRSQQQASEPEKEEHTRQLQVRPHAAAALPAGLLEGPARADGGGVAHRRERPAHRRRAARRCSGSRASCSRDGEPLPPSGWSRWCCRRCPRGCAPRARSRRELRLRARDREAQGRFRVNVSPAAHRAQGLASGSSPGRCPPLESLGLPAGHRQGDAPPPGPHRRHRPVGPRQDEHAGGDGGHHQPRDDPPHPHGGGPGGVRAPAQARR